MYLEEKLGAHIPEVKRSDTELLNEYERLCTKLGITCPSNYTLNEKIKKLLADNNIKIYPNDKVDKYLSEIAHKLSGRWSGYNSIYAWTLLSITGTVNYRVSDVSSDITKRELSEAENGEKLKASFYTKPIPIEILRQVDLIHTSFPSAKFYVSDLYRTKVVYPDPFIMVEDIIFGCWDEPGFTKEK